MSAIGIKAAAEKYGKFKQADVFPFLSEFSRAKMPYNLPYFSPAGMIEV